MNLATILIAIAVGAVFVAIVVNEIRKKKKGISSCSCGGNCGACGGNCQNRK